jgi:hypothetical protein
MTQSKIVSLALFVLRFMSLIGHKYLRKFIRSPVTSAGDIQLNNLPHTRQNYKPFHLNHASYSSHSQWLPSNLRAYHSDQRSHITCGSAAPVNCSPLTNYHPGIRHCPPETKKTPRFHPYVSLSPHRLFVIQFSTHHR